MGHYDPREEEWDAENERIEMLGKRIKSTVKKFSNKDLIEKFDEIRSELRYIEGAATGNCSLFKAINNVKTEFYDLLGIAE